MKTPFSTLGDTVLSRLAGYLMSTGGKPEGIIVFVVIVALSASKVFE